jgi:hypothetical protein
LRKTRPGPAVAAWAVVCGAVCAAALMLSGCSVFGSNKSASASESVFAVRPGQCFRSPADVKAELATLNRTSCKQSHTQEAYALVNYTNPDGSAASAYPGSDLLTSFAQGACAQHFTDYVGIDYLDSSLYFTYLLPSARSWESDDDHDIICFVTTTGSALTSSVKGSKK